VRSQSGIVVGSDILADGDWFWMLVVVVALKIVVYWAASEDILAHKSRYVLFTLHSLEDHALV